MAFLKVNYMRSCCKYGYGLSVIGRICYNFLIKIWCSAANQFYQMLNAVRMGKTYLIGIGIKAKI